ncbi:hypothetical protein IWW55_002985 [Coemansia sp. RSA 2706]|nr:hypothetical protein IWW55_002985 [Coemansia sp. RSA 2706]
MRCSLLSLTHAALGGLAIAAAWAIAYTQSPKLVDAKHLQDWAFSKLWSHMSQTMAARLDAVRRPLWAQAHGRVLELGIGHGEALALLPRDADGRVHGISSYTALEPNAFLHARLARTAAAAGLAVTYDPATCPDSARADSGNPEGYPVLTIVNATLDRGYAPESVRAPFDVIIASMVLCSVADVHANLQAIHALLAPGGRFIFVEHVRHTDDADSLQLRALAALQTAMTPVWRLVTGNCHLDRRTGRAIAEMPGWARVEYRTHRGTDGLVDRLTPFVYGVAIKE